MTTTAVATLAAKPSATHQLRTLVVRNLVKTLRVPQLLMFSMAMPLTMLVLFSQVFRSIASARSFPPGISYIDFITPALLAISTVMSGTNSGVAVATDLASGVFDRFTALPMAIPVLYLARALTDLVLTVVRVLVLLAAASLFLGFHFSGSPLDFVALVAVLLPLSFAMSWLFLLFGVRLGQPEVVQFAGMMLMMPFMFLSSAFAPLATMPGWLQAVAKVNPVTHTIDAARSLTFGHPDAGAIVAAVVSASILAGLAAAATTIATARRGRT